MGGVGASLVIGICEIVAVGAGVGVEVVAFDPLLSSDFEHPRAANARSPLKSLACHAYEFENACTDRMKLIDRYVGKEILLTASMAVAVLSLVLVLGNVFKQLFDLLVNHNVPLDYILAFIGYIIPFSLTFTIPWGFLTSVLLVFGKLSAENELIALRATGVSIPRVCYSLFALAAICCGICFWINVAVAPAAQQKMKEALFNIATSNPIAMFTSDQVIDDFPDTKIYVGSKNGPNLQNLLMYKTGKSGDPLEVVYARSGSLEVDKSNMQVLLKLINAQIEQRDENHSSDFTRIQQGIVAQNIVLPISLEDLYNRAKSKRSASTMTLNELITNLKEQPQGKQGKVDAGALSALRTEINKRYSFSLASLAFAIIGVPLGITAHRRETSVGFLFSIVVAFVYFFFIIIADSLKNNPHAHSDLLIWLPNVLFITLGTYLFVRLARR